MDVCGEYSFCSFVPFDFQRNHGVTADSAQFCSYRQLWKVGVNLWSESVLVLTKGAHGDRERLWLFMNEVDPCWSLRNPVNVGALIDNLSVSFVSDIISSKAHFIYRCAVVSSVEISFTLVSFDLSAVRINHVLHKLVGAWGVVLESVSTLFVLTFWWDCCACFVPVRILDDWIEGGVVLIELLNSFLLANWVFECINWVKLANRRLV